MALRYPPIPDSTTDPASLRATDLAIKETLEILTRQRGDPLLAAVTWGDLVALGLITSAQVPVKLGNK